MRISAPIMENQIENEIETTMWGLGLRLRDIAELMEGSIWTRNWKTKWNLGSCKGCRVKGLEAWGPMPACWLADAS